MKAVLLPNLVQFNALSMTRYAAELMACLEACPRPGWTFEMVTCEHVELVARLIPGAAGRKAAEQLGRLIKYPLVASQISGDVFHILDHSHAHLIPALDPSKTIITCHDLIPLLAIRGDLDIHVASTTRRTFPMRLACIRRVAIVIADSESTRRDLINLAGVSEHRIKVVPLGVKSAYCPVADPSRLREIRERVRSTYGIPADAKVILHVATGGRYKNSSTLTRAMNEVLQNETLRANTWLLRVGADFSPDERSLVQSLGLNERIVWAGPIYVDEQLADVYRAADVFAFPSLYEGFGLPPLEAMACGLPVVVSNAASIPEVVADCGLQVEPMDYKSLASSLADVLTNESLGEKLKAAGILRAKMFSWQNTADKTMRVYEQLVEQSTTGKAV